IAWQRDGSELRWGQKGEREPCSLRLVLKIHVSIHDTVDLRLPGVRCHQDAHQGTGDMAGDLEDADCKARRRSLQRRISSRPSACSATAVPLSTQSPVFTYWMPSIRCIEA